MLPYRLALVLPIPVISVPADPAITMLEVIVQARDALLKAARQILVSPSVRAPSGGDVSHASLCTSHLASSTSPPTPQVSDTKMSIMKHIRRVRNS